MLSLLRLDPELPLLTRLRGGSNWDLKLCTWCSMAVRLPVKVRTSLLVWSSTYLQVDEQQDNKDRSDGVLRQCQLSCCSYGMPPSRNRAAGNHSIGSWLGSV
jgi:hypothetical protein